MTDRERLIELILKVKDVVKQHGFDFNAFVIADYLIDNGVIVLPCKLGDTVYVTDYTITGNKIFECTIDKISHYSYGTYYSLNWGRNIRRIRSFRSDSLGKTVFLTREEAEKALKERESNEG